MTALKQGDHVYLIDGSGYIFRAYHALPPLTRKSDGLPTGAVHGFCNMLYKLLSEPIDGRIPTHLAVIFDYSGRSFRNDIYDAYKAHRPPPPEDLVPQFGLIREATRAFNVPCIEMEGYEADDLIATYARQAEAAGADVTIISSDKDLMQLVSPLVMLYDTMKDRAIDAAGVMEKFGVGPDKVIEVQALAGDSVDNVPGVPGIGVKTGAQLIAEYGDLETLLARAGEIKQAKRRERLIEFADQARLSRELVTLKLDVAVEAPLEDFAVAPPDARTLIGFLKAMEFTTLTRRMAAAYEADADAIEAGTVEVKNWVFEAPATPTAPSPGLDGAPTPAARAAAAAEAICSLPIDPSAYVTVTDLATLEAWCARAMAQGYVAVDTETTSLDAMQADLVGVSLALAPGEACYVPLAHRGADDLGLDGPTVAQIPSTAAIAALKPMLEDPGTLKIAQNLKYDWLVLKRRGIDVAPFDDTMLLAYALDSGLGGHGMDDLCQRLVGHKPIAFKEVAGSGKSMITFDRVPVDKATAYAGEDADVTLRLWMLLKPRLAAEGLTTVYETLERPMVPVLGRMEREGITIDRAVLSRLSGDFAQSMAGLEHEIHELAGEPFNIGSPKQLGEILFDKMNLAGGKKTKTGAWGTGADVLEVLAAEGNPLPARVLDWRQMAKLKSTYTDALPGFINPETGRVHTSYALASTSTGRLSSTDPNLQNIPVRTEAGRKIRTAFIAAPGHKLVSADYSQIELRVLAHIADIASLKQAFADGLDIHAMTASEMFGVPVEGMDPMVRRRAKAINFGIIYGISAFGLANQLAIPRGEAKDYIDMYFKRFPGIRDYMEATKEHCRKSGHVETVFGRKAHYPEINSKNPNHRAFMERAAINAPIQGSAADIIRRAMIRMHAALDAAGLQARMLLQVHDELIFEAPDAEVAKTIEIAVAVMEKAPEPAVKLSVPLRVDARAAVNWEEAH
jgi:DNA polymerase-1